MSQKDYVHVLEHALFLIKDLCDRGCFNEEGTFMYDYEEILEQVKGVVDNVELNYKGKVDITN